MNYFEVLIASSTYHGNDPLTYSSPDKISPGTLVKVSMRNDAVLGVVLRGVEKPSFTTKPILTTAPFRPLPKETLRLMEWLRAYYPAPLGTVVRQFVPGSSIIPMQEKSDTKIYTTPKTLPPLRSEQRDALAIIQDPGTYLLHGITGSGKSRVYIELAKRSIDQGKSAVILTPEIGLTTQLTRNFKEVFQKNVHVLHSQLTVAERRKLYYEILESIEPSIIIGPRSALFSPTRNIGLIVLDESHDNAYKNESAPHYQTTRVAAKLSELHKAILVLGSATPAIEDYYLATIKHRPIVTMHALAKQTGSAVDFKTVDMRKHDQFTRSPLLSDILLKHIAEAMKNNEQSLVFLNRRGTANVVLCNNCGWQSVCPNCDLSLTYHGDTHELRCHVCGYLSAIPSVCPTCGEADILYKSIGTKAVTSALEKIFPSARIQRFDTDTKKSERLERHIDGIAEGGIDILVGTQMIGKGLDLPNLSVVGVVNADSSLLLPDYTAAEKTYQLINQVVGRVGRGHRPGFVIIQTYDPDNSTIQAAIHSRWQDFYDNELRERRQYRFPPFVYLLKLRTLRATSDAAEKAAQALSTTLSQSYPDIRIDGPSPSFHPRERSKYSWQILIKSNLRKPLIDIIHDLPSGWHYDIDPSNLL